MNKLKSYISRIDKKTLRLVGVVVIALGIPIGVYLVSRVIRFQTPATTDPVDVYFSPGSQTMPPDSVFRVMANTRSNSVVFAKVVFTFDKAVVNLESEITTTSRMSNVIRKSTRAEANTSGRVEFILAVPPLPQLPTSPSCGSGQILDPVTNECVSELPSGVFELASFTLGLVNDAVPSNTSLDFVTTEMQIVNGDTGIAILQSTPATIGAPTDPTTNLSATPSPIVCPPGEAYNQTLGICVPVTPTPLPPDEGGPTPTTPAGPTPTTASTDPTATPRPPTPTIPQFQSCSTSGGICRSTCLPGESVNLSLPCTVPLVCCTVGSPM